LSEFAALKTPAIGKIETGITVKLVFHWPIRQKYDNSEKFAAVCLQVCAEHEETNDKGETRRRLYVRQYRLPKGVDVEHLRPSLSKDGVLTIEAPATGLAPSERLLPIQYQTDNAGSDTSTVN
jgi:Hsp20/alpha crystallin family